MLRKYSGVYRNKRIGKAHPAAAVLPFTGAFTRRMGAAAQAWPSCCPSHTSFSQQHHHPAPSCRFLVALESHKEWKVALQLDLTAPLQGPEVVESAVQRADSILTLQLATHQRVGNTLVFYDPFKE